MSASKQVVFASDLNGQSGTVSVFDLSTGTSLRSYKNGGVACPGSLSLCSDQYLVTAQKDSPLVHIWALKSKEQIHKKFVCSGNVTAITVIPNGNFAVVAVNEQIFLYQLSSGSLLAKLERHFQPVTCIKASGDSSYFISGGEDGLVALWYLPDILSTCYRGLTSEGYLPNKDPKYTWSHHSAQIADIYCTYSTLNGKCATCSLDKTCKIYDVLNGALIVSLVFDSPLWSVTMDPAQYFLFVGGESGNIYETKLYEKPLQSISRSSDPEPTFLGHSGKVSCLSTSTDGVALISGSYDNTVKIWHVLSKQCMRTVHYKGPIGNVMVSLTPAGLLDDNRDLMPINFFKKEAEEDATISVCIPQKDTLRDAFHISYSNLLNGQSGNSFPKNTQDTNAEAEVKNLKILNEKMYSYAVDALFKSLSR